MAHHFWNPNVRGDISSLFSLICKEDHLRSERIAELEYPLLNLARLKRYVQTHDAESEEGWGWGWVWYLTWAGLSLYTWIQAVSEQNKGYKYWILAGCVLVTGFVLAHARYGPYWLKHRAERQAAREQIKSEPYAPALAAHFQHELESHQLYTIGTCEEDDKSELGRLFLYLQYPVKDRTGKDASSERSSVQGYRTSAELTSADIPNLFTNIQDVESALTVLKRYRALREETYQQVFARAKRALERYESIDRIKKLTNSKVAGQEADLSFDLQSRLRDGIQAELSSIEETLKGIEKELDQVKPAVLDTISKALEASTPTPNAEPTQERFRLPTEAPPSSEPAELDPASAAPERRRA